ncbi:gag-pol polyprotein [Tanacetum coccineum]
MSTQQDIYAAGSENRPPMLNKENYVPWSSRLLRYAKSRPNGKLIYNSIMNGPYVRRMIPELDIYAAVDSCETAQEIWLCVQQMMKGSDIGIQEKKAKLFNEWERFTSTDGESIKSYYHCFSKLMNDFKRNKHFTEKISSNLKFLNNLQPEWSRHVTIVHQTKDLHTTDYTQLYDFLKYNQKEIAQPGMNLGQDNQMQMVGGNWGNQFRQYAGQNEGNQVVQNAVQNPGVQNVGNKNGIRCYNCRGLGHTARNCTVRPRRRDAAYLQTQLLIAQKEEAGIQLQAEEFDLMAAAANLDEIKEVNANCILMANLQQASTSGTQSDNAPVYDTDGSAEVQLHENCYNNEIFNMFTQEEQYTELLEPIPEPHQVPQNVNNVISEVSSVEQGGGTVEQHSANVKETRAYHESLFHNLAAEVEKVISINLKMKEKNAELTTELARYKNQERCFEISQEKYDKLERCYQQSVYQEQCLSKKINALYLSSEEKKRLKFDFKAREDELLDKQIQLENKIKELDNILVKMGQSIQMMHMLSPKPDLFYHTEQKMDLEFSDDTTPSVARKFLNEVKSTIVTLQRVVKQKMTLDIHNWSSSAHQEIHKIVKDEIFPIVNQVDARVQNFKIQFLKEAAKFVRDFQSLAKEADESLAKHKALELEIERLLRAVVSQDIMAIVQNPSVCEECKYDKILYDKAYNEMQQKIKRLQAQLGDQKGKSKDTPYVSDTFNPLFQKLENKNLRAQIFDKVSEQKDTNKGTSVNTQFCKQLILGNPPSSSGPKLYSVTPFLKSTGLLKINETHALSKSVTSNSVPKPQESKVVKNEKVIAPEMFRIDPCKTSREDKFVPINKVRASIRTNLIIISQPHAITKKVVNFDSNGFSSTGVDIITKTRRPQPRSNTKNDRLAIWNDKSEVVCAICKQCLITANHDVYVLNYVNGMNSRGKKQKANVSNTRNQKKQKPKVMKPKKVGSNKRLASPKPSKNRSCLRWSPTGRIFELKGKIIESSESESQYDCSKGDNACIFNPHEPTRKRFPNSTFSLAGHSNLFMVRRLGMLKAYDRKSEASHKFHLEVLGNRPLWK